MTVGRFAPSPSGSLHLGNLRTALVAWCAARVDGGTFLVRMEDLTTGAAPVAEAEQLDDLALLGLIHETPVVRQSERTHLYADAIERLVALDLTYPCYCSRREIREAAAAPHGSAAEGVYPGTCRELSALQRDELEASGRRPAVRLRAEGLAIEFQDRGHGWCKGVVDDFVLCRADGVAAYNLAVVVDDADQGVDQVVRGDDLLDTTPRQVLLQHLLGVPTPEYLHTPLVLGPDGVRLSKRHGAVGLRDQLALGATPASVLGLFAWSLGIASPGELLAAEDVAERFRDAPPPTGPWRLEPSDLRW